jgi:hypothetical protein
MAIWRCSGARKIPRRRRNRKLASRPTLVACFTCTKQCMVVGYGVSGFENEFIFCKRPRRALGTAAGNPQSRSAALQTQRRSSSLRGGAVQAQNVWRPAGQPVIGDLSMSSGSKDRPQRRGSLSECGSPAAFVAIAGPCYRQGERADPSSADARLFFAAGRIHNRRTLAFLGLYFFYMAELIADGVVRQVLTVAIAGLQFTE